MSVYKKQTKEQRIFGRLKKIDAECARTKIVSRISCPICTSHKIYSCRKWEWNHQFKEVDLISDWTCKDCKSDFDGVELEQVK